jgi:peptide/nickel transport system permease protein
VSDKGALKTAIGMLASDTRKEKVRLLVKDARRIWRGFRRNRGGMFGLTVLIVFAVMSVFAPILATHKNPDAISWARVNPVYHPPSAQFLFGTDVNGRDVYSLTIWGSRASLIVGLVASVISIVLGTSIGLVSGFYGKFSDEVLMRFTDFFLVIPWFPLMIVFSMVMGKTFLNVIIVIGITSWPSTARIVRSQVLSVKEKAFVERARAVGSGNMRIISRHILPNVFPLIFANTVLLVANSIFSESFLDFFGFGDLRVISWGTMLENAYSAGAFSSAAWWWILFPGASIVLLIMAFYLIGDSLDDVMNPKLRRR